MIPNPKFTLNQGTAILPNLPPWLGYPGNIWHVKPYSGDDTKSGKSLSSAFKTVKVALAAATENQNDVIYLHSEEVDGSLTTDLLASTLTWNKKLVHLIGVNSGVSLSPRSRISPVSTYTAAAPTMNVTAGGCYFANLQIIMDVDHATPLGALSITGGIRNRFDNCHVYGTVYAASDIAGSYSLLLSGAEECEFHGCQFGSDRIAKGAQANSVLLFAATSKNIVFNGCTFRMVTTHGTNHLFVRAAAGSLDGSVLFRNGCNGINSQSRNVSGLELTYALSVASDAGGDVIVDATSAFQATDLNATDAGNVYALGAGGGILVPATK